jgi:hypothetical protein
MLSRRCVVSAVITSFGFSRTVVLVCPYSYLVSNTGAGSVAGVRGRMCLLCKAVWVSVIGIDEGGKSRVLYETWWNAPRWIRRVASVLARWPRQHAGVGTKCLRNRPGCERRMSEGIVECWLCSALYRLFSYAWIVEPLSRKLPISESVSSNDFAGQQGSMVLYLRIRLLMIAARGESVSSEQACRRARSWVTSAQMMTVWDRGAEGCRGLEERRGGENIMTQQKSRRAVIGASRSGRGRGTTGWNK